MTRRTKLSNTRNIVVLKTIGQQTISNRYIVSYDINLNTVRKKSHNFSYQKLIHGKKPQLGYPAYCLIMLISVGAQFYEVMSFNSCCKTHQGYNLLCISLFLLGTPTSCLKGVSIINFCWKFYNLKIDVLMFINVSSIYLSI